MKNKNIIIIALAALSLTGCKSLYGNYERPDVKTNGIVRDPVDDKTALEGANDFGNLSWRSVFTDPQLQALIEKALNNNPDLLNAALNVDIAEQQVKMAKLAFLPSVVFAPTGTISHFGTHTSSTQSYTLPIAASWDVDLFGKLRSQKKAAQMLLLQSKDYKVAVQTSLICNVANLYYTLLMLDRQKQIVDDMSGLTKNTWDMMKLQMDFGRARSTSVQSAEAAYYSVQTQAADIRRQIRETENSLSLLLGEPAQGIVRGSLDNQSLRVAEDKYKQAYNTWQNSILKAGSEVSNALVAYNSANEKEKLQQQQIDVLKQNVEHTQMLYAQSSSTYLEVITAQQSLLNAQISQIREQFTKLQSIVNLYNALGGGSK